MNKRLSVMASKEMGTHIITALKADTKSCNASGCSLIYDGHQKIDTSEVTDRSERSIDREGRWYVMCLRC